MHVGCSTVWNSFAVINSWGASDGAGARMCVFHSVCLCVTQASQGMAQAAPN
jgi:hypothetical protein